MGKELINLSNLQRFLSKLSEKFALKKAMKGISEDAEGNIIIGEEGLVPTPNENSKGKFLRSDGEWALPSETAVYESMTIEEGVAGVSKVDRVINAKNLKQIVNSDGFLTSLDSSKLTGVINIENLPQGALERILIVSSKEERLTLLETEVQLGDVVKESDTGLMYYVINTEKLNSEEGYTQFTAGSASSVPWSGVTDKPLIPTKTSELTNDSDFAVDNNVVHKSGNETIDGIKTFNDTVVQKKDGIIKNDNVDITTTPSSNFFTHLFFADKNSVANAYMRYGQRTNGINELNLFVRDKDLNNYGVSVNTNNEFIPVLNNTYSLGSANAKWKKIYSDDVVHTSGNENISGNKVFRDPIFRKFDITTNLADIVYRFEDSNDTPCGYIQNNVHYWKNNLHNRHLTHNNTSGKDIYLDIISRNNGTGTINIGGDVTSIDNINGVTSDTNSAIVATMGWVNNPETSTNVVHRSGDETITGNKTFSNRISFPSGYWITTDTNDNSLRIIRDGTGHGNNYKVIIQGDTGKIFAPNGFIGNLQGNADTATSANDPNAVHKTGNETIAGTKTFSNTIISNSVKCTDGNAFLAQNGSYTFLIRNDGSDTYFLMSDKDGTPGTWSTARPLMINNATGVCNINGNANSATYATSAASSTKATQDSAGQQIDKTYIKELSVSGRTITYKRGDNTTGTITTQDTNTTYSKLSQFTNDSGFITSSGSCNYATTAGSANSVAWSNVTGKPNLATNTFVKGTNYWYRKHSDGFIEMGGFTNCADKTGSAVATNIPLAFSNTNYTLIVQLTRGTGYGDRWGDDYMCSFTQTKTTTGFVVYSNHLSETGSNGGGYDWYACGY